MSDMQLAQTLEGAEWVRGLVALERFVAGVSDSVAAPVAVFERRGVGAGVAPSLLSSGGLSAEMRTKLRRAGRRLSGASELKTGGVEFGLWSEAVGEREFTVALGESPQSVSNLDALRAAMNRALRGFVTGEGERLRAASVQGDAARTICAVGPPRTWHAPSPVPTPATLVRADGDAHRVFQGHASSTPQVMRITEGLEDLGRRGSA